MEEEWKKLFFVFILSTYLRVVLLKFRTGEIPDPATPKNKKYLKKHDDDVIIMFFHVFLIFVVARSIKSMRCGYSLDVELNSASNELSYSEFD